MDLGSVPRATSVVMEGVMVLRLPKEMSALAALKVLVDPEKLAAA